jgi:hypothetical protein
LGEKSLKRPLVVFYEPAFLVIPQGGKTGVEKKRFGQKLPKTQPSKPNFKQPLKLPSPWERGWG